MALVGAGQAAAQGGAPAGLNIYPSFHLKFENKGRNYLLASTVIVNVSDMTVRNLTVSQKYPDGLVPEAAPESIHEYFARPEGFRDSIDGQTYTMSTPILRKGEITSAVVVLRYDGRPSDVDIPPAHADYTAAGKNYSEDGPPLKLQLGKYSKYSGNLSDFIKRYAGIFMTFPTLSGPDWGFSSFASRVRAKTPIGMVEIDGNADEGRFSIVRGAPGETRFMLVSWKPQSRAKPATTEAEVRQIVDRQIFASSDFVIDSKDAKIEKTRVGRNDAWTLTSRWKDRIVDRLGEGPVKWYVIDDHSNSRQYVIMIAAQGRGAGPEKSATPAPDKEAELMKELEKIVSTFRPV